MTTLHLAGDAHADVQALLPWYLNQSLSPEERARIDRHLAACPLCQAELDSERALQKACAADEGRIDPADAARGFEELRARLDALPPAVAAPKPPKPPARGGLAAWLPWLLGGQFALIALLSVALVLPRAETPAYRGLGATPPADVANAIVMFRPEATEAAVRASLREAGARLVGGPTEGNAYLLNVPAAGAIGAVSRLRANPAVSLAESLAPEPSR